MDEDHLLVPRLCAAIVDRLTFAGQIIETGTTSYRFAPRPGPARRRLTKTTSRGLTGRVDTVPE